MAETSQIIRNHRPTRFPSREYIRYKRCSRPRSVYHRSELCRICLKDLAHKGQTPDVKKASW